MESSARGAGCRAPHFSTCCDGKLRLRADCNFSSGGGGRQSSKHIIQGVITGVGFIGAGAIIKEGAAVTGHATAASVWTVGIIGAAVGYGYYDIWLILAAANLAVLLIRAQSPARSSVAENDNPSVGKT
jgi:putative Mg2+ transporter-C (MgtC) family protein